MLRSALVVDTQRTGRHRRIRRRRAFGILAICLAGAVVSLFAGAGLLVYQVNVARDAIIVRSELADRSQQLQAIQGLLLDAETGQRGLLLTGRGIHLTPYENAARTLPGFIDQAIKASSEDHLVLPHLHEIKRVADLKLAELAESVRLFQSGQADAAIAMVQTGSGGQYMAELRSRAALALESLAAQASAADANGLASMVAARRLAWWAAVSLAAVVLLVALQLRSLSRLRSSYQDQVAAQASMLNTTVDQIPASLAIVDRDMRYRLVNKAFERWRGLQRDAVIGRTIREVMGDEEFERSKIWFERALRGEAVSYEKSYPERPISLIVANYCPMLLEDGSVAGVVAMAHDATAHRNERERLQRLSERDPLTGLLNRAAFEIWLTESSTGADASEIGLLYVDLDHFKPVNDKYGHLAGDSVLREIANRLRGVVRPTDAVARLGGDEFAIGLTGVKNLADLQLVAGKVVAEARRPIRVDTHVVRISASVGIAVDASAAQGGGKELVARADDMLYRAKRSGRDRFSMHLVKS